MYQPASLRLALGLGDQELEQRLRPAFDAADDVVVGAQCLAADQLVEAVESRQVDAVVVAWSLHRLSDAVLEHLDRSGLPIVLLVPDPHDQRWRGRRGPVMAVGSDAASICQALVALRRGESVLNLSRPRPAPPATAITPDTGRAGLSASLSVTGCGAGRDRLRLRTDSPRRAATSA